MAWESRKIAIVYNGVEPGTEVRPVLHAPIWRYHSGGASRMNKKLNTSLQSMRHMNCSLDDGDVYPHIDAPAALLSGLLRTEWVLRRITNAAIRNDGAAETALFRKARRLSEEVKKIFLQIHAPDPTLSEYLERVGLATIFPRCLSLFKMKREMSLSTKRVKMDAYLPHLAILHQLVSICEQIRSALDNAPDHKYIAHQISLLYQSLSHASTPVAEYSKQIEEMFPKIKIATRHEDGVVVKLPFDLAFWLRNVLNGIIETVYSLPDMYIAPLLPVLSYLEGATTGVYGAGPHLQSQYEHNHVEL
eukprot:m.313550 g.313550  ORF g.313550 m.313550 type:complete len:304 (+) comp16491_c2_seq4:70-981(+)